MAPPSRTVATSSSRRPAQPRPPHSQEYVDAHPELCLAPRVMPVPLPQHASPSWQHSTHTTHPTAYAPQHERGVTDTRGALHLALGPRPRPRVVHGPIVSASRIHYPPAYPPANAYPVTSPPPYPVAASAMPAHVPPVRSAPITVPKPRSPPSPRPPTPEPTPPQHRPIVAPRRNRASADPTRHGFSPT